MKIVNYRVSIASFDPDNIPNSATIDEVLKSNIATEDGNITVHTEFVSEATIDLATVDGTFAKSPKNSKTSEKHA